MAELKIRGNSTDQKFYDAYAIAQNSGKTAFGEKPKAMAAYVAGVERAADSAVAILGHAAGRQLGKEEMGRLQDNLGFLAGSVPKGASFREASNLAGDINGFAQKISNDSRPGLSVIYEGQELARKVLGQARDAAKP